MGLFDYIEIEQELPLLDYIPASMVSIIRNSFNKDTFQTKDFECVLDNYRVSENGELYLSSSSWFSDKVIEPEVLIDFHGIITANTIVYIDDSNLLDVGEHLGLEPSGYKSRTIGPNVKKNWLFVSYKLKFTDGILVKINMVSPTEKEVLDLL